MDRIGLIAAAEVPGETLAALSVSIRKVLHAFRANDAFQARMRASGIKLVRPNKNRHSYGRAAPGEQVKTNRPRGQRGRGVNEAAAHSAQTD